MLVKKIVLLGLVLTGVCFRSLSQAGASALGDLGVRHTLVLGGNYGAIWAHNPPVYHLAQSHPWQVAIEHYRYSAGKEWSRSWSRKNDHPFWGMALQYFHFRSPALGSSLAGIVFLEPVLFRSLRYRVGTGMVTNFKPFNLEANQTNNMLGGSLALVMHAQVNYYQTLTASTQLRFGIGLTHFSNGAFTQPNSGINNFFAGVALCRHLVTVRGGSATPDSVLYPVGFSAVSSGSFSLVEKFPVNGPKYGVYQAAVRAQYRFGRKSSLAVGLDYCHNGAIAAFLNERPDLGSETGRVGAVFGHELHISRVSMLTELGVYLRKKQAFDPGYYQRVGLRYNLAKHIFAGMYLKSHKARAECIEWSLGVRLGKLG